jgi:hypothetical protein
MAALRARRSLSNASIEVSNSVWASYEKVRDEGELCPLI